MHNTPFFYGKSVEFGKIQERDKNSNETFLGVFSSTTAETNGQTQKVDAKIIRHFKNNDAF